MNFIFDWIKQVTSGKKTYFVGALTIVLGILQQDYELILQGAGIIALRLGIAKS